MNNPRPERRDDLVKIWFPNEATPFIDAATRTVNVAQVYQSATPRYVVEYGQDPTDADMYGRVVRETVGDPANGVGGTYQYLYTTQNLPANLIDPGDPIVFRCMLTDRNDNQTIYDFNAAQMPVRVEVIRSRVEDRHPVVRRVPQLRDLDPVQSATTSPCSWSCRRATASQYVYEDGNVSGLGFYNRRVGLLLSRTAYAGQYAGHFRPCGQQRADPAHGDVLLRPDLQPAVREDRARGNPIDAPDGYFTPQNGGTAPGDSDRSRYATITYYDYQKDDGRHDHAATRTCRPCLVWMPPRSRPCSTSSTAR